jgi:hypothetical protein
VSSWNEFKQWVGRNVNVGKKYYFRGQSNSIWKLTTTFHRSSEGKGIEMEKYFSEIIKDVHYQVSSIEKPINLKDGQEFEGVQYSVSADHRSI